MPTAAAAVKFNDARDITPESAIRHTQHEKEIPSIIPHQSGQARRLSCPR